MVTELSEGEKAFLAREIAADKFAGCYDNEGKRRAFVTGWDSAIEQSGERETAQRSALKACRKIFVQGARNTLDPEWQTAYELVCSALGEEP